MTDLATPPRYERRGRSPHKRNTGPMHAVAKCGARTRAGTPCKAPCVSGRHRCRMHGGAAGSGGQPGNRNAWKHGRFSGPAKLRRRQLRKAMNDFREAMAIFRAAPLIGRRAATRLMEAIDSDPGLEMPPEMDWRHWHVDAGVLEPIARGLAADTARCRALQDLTDDGFLPYMASMFDFGTSGNHTERQYGATRLRTDEDVIRRALATMPEVEEKAERTRRAAEAEAELRRLGMIPPFVEEGAADALTLPSLRDGPLPLPQAGEGKESDGPLPLPQAAEKETCDGHRAPSPAGGRGGVPRPFKSRGHPVTPSGRGTGVRAPPVPLPVSTDLATLDDYFLRPGEVAGRVWDSRIHGFGARRPVIDDDDF